MQIGDGGSAAFLPSSGFTKWMGDDSSEELWQQISQKLWSEMCFYAIKKVL
jgi:hypothetical protein